VIDAILSLLGLVRKSRVQQVFHLVDYTYSDLLQSSAWWELSLSEEDPDIPRWRTVRDMLKEIK